MQNGPLGLLRRVACFLTFLGRRGNCPRARLVAGGNTGAFKISGFSSMVLDALGIDESAFRDAVAAATDVARWLRTHADTAKYEAINTKLLSRTIEAISRNNPDYFANYPIARELPKETIHFDVLDQDDDLIFG